MLDLGIGQLRVGFLIVNVVEMLVILVERLQVVMHGREMAVKKLHVELSEVVVNVKLGKLEALEKHISVGKNQISWCVLNNYF